MYIICDDINVYGFHRNIFFWIASKTFQYGFKQIGLDAKIILNTDSRLRKLVENETWRLPKHNKSWAASGAAAGPRTCKEINAYQ